MNILSEGALTGFQFSAENSQIKPKFPDWEHWLTPWHAFIFPAFRVTFSSLGN
jgi:hypothetical protein